MIGSHPLTLVLGKAVDEAFLVPHLFSLRTDKGFELVDRFRRIRPLSIQLLELTAVSVKLSSSLSRFGLSVLYLSKSLRVLTAVGSCLALTLVLDGLVILSDLRFRSKSLLMDASLLSLQQRQ